MDKGVTEEINILECLSLHPMIHLTVSKVSQTWSLEQRTIMENKRSLKSHVPAILLSCDTCCVDVKVAKPPDYFFLYKMTIMKIPKGIS